MWNLVGFQTRLRIPEQQRVFRMIPGLEYAEFLRFGSIHRNSYLNSPASLGPALTARDDDRLFFAGQLTGVEGYTESLGTGLLAGINLARRLDGQPAAVPPPTTMLGGLYRYLARGGSEALPADERELRAARSAAGQGEEGPRRRSCWSSGRRRTSGWMSVGSGRTGETESPSGTVGSLTAAEGTHSASAMVSVVVCASSDRIVTTLCLCASSDSKRTDAET